MGLFDFIHSFQDVIYNSTFRQWIISTYPFMLLTEKMLIIIGCIIVSILLRVAFYKWKSKFLVIRGSNISTVPKTRFRKRDRVLFYGRKMLRKVKNISGQVHGQGKKRKLVIKFARRLLQMRKETLPQRLNVLEPPAEYLEEELITKDGQNVPPDAFYMLQSIRVFGHFEKPVFLRLCRHTEILNVHAGSHLFKVGDPDENVFIVQSGLVSVNITSIDGSIIPLKLVKTGDCVTSLLSFTDVLTGHKKNYKTVSAQALEDSTIVRLPVAAFQEIFHDYPDSLIQIIQVVMVRLQRVTFTALHQYLGLSTELVQNGLDERKMSPFISERKNESSMFSQQETSISEKKLESFLNQPKTDQKDWYLKIAIKVFVKKLQLDNEDLLLGKVEIRKIPTNTFVMQEDSHKDAALVLLLNGSILVSQKMDPEGLTEAYMYSVNPGDIVGGLAVLTGEPGFLTFRADRPSVISILSKKTVYEIMRVKPQIVLPIANTVVTRLSSFVRQVDFALDWLFIESGRAVYRQGEESDSTFIVLSGRLRSVITHENGKKELVAEYGKGDLVGIVEVITQTPRGTTVMAVRDSELAKLPEGLFNAIKKRFPGVVSTLINLLGHRILGTWQKPTISKTLDTRPTQSNFSTIAIVPISDDVPLTSFTYELYHSLCSIRSTLRLTSEFVRSMLGKSIMDLNNEYRLTTWLAQQEDQYKIALYQCDYSFSSWTQRCIRQADCILLVTLGNKQPTLGKYEKDIERLALRTHKELILIHREDSDLPSNTVEWLNIRSWVSSHHHVQCPKRIFSKRSVSVISDQYEKILKTEVNIHSDYSRLARWLTGTSVGLVLGGGGARGAAHIGMIKAIQEAGIPIDMVGGVSIGAFMGAVWCSERDIIGMTRKASSWAESMTNRWRQVLDLTWPSTSMLTGQYFNHTLISALGETQIEDLWLPYFTITTDISASKMRIHTHGSLWRYVRSSMSLSGYMPPLCDPIDGHLLLDGGYINNLPADIMRNLGAKHVLAIDVGSQDDMDFTNYGDSLSGFWLLWKRFNPFTASVKVPNLEDIQSRLAYVSCVRQLEVVKTSDYCQYIRPPIDKYKTLQFKSFEEIKEVGYQHGKTYFAGLKLAGKIPFGKQESMMSHIKTD
ncbi:neuropathy target esterase sws isoform X1 [Rhopalosiphum maidis]|uniref:neuropathy target esterase sws isoform X1 n=3 Tax=Rhopalosiphum maidis TaxID=43146 RepID=UPI000EFE07F5|nr:neuropathy target esterase sws isoform X1 [Rhopalosiphum maidis]XP_026806454.1 neuropathy target esterase sws isoform X1 [Rhopalosiphum maidis]